MSDKFVKYHGLVSPGRYRKIQCREYPPNKSYLIRPPEAKIKETQGQLPDIYYPMTTDRYGFINPHYGNIETDPNVVFLGGSTTECIWNLEDKRWPNLVARLFNANGRNALPINTINSGVWGNTTAQCINLLFNKIVPLCPHACVLMHNINDLVLMIHEGDYWKAQIPSRQIMYRTVWDGIETEEALRRILKARFRQWYQGLIKRRQTSAVKPKDDEFASTRRQQSQLDPERYTALFSANLRIFVSICRAHGIRPVLMTQASRLKVEVDPDIRQHVVTMLEGKGLTYEQVQQYYESLNECTRNVANDLDVPIIDLDQEIPKTREMMFDSVHYTDAGCVRVAEYIAERFTELRMGQSIV